MNFGLIADGNRRWARDLGLDTQEGHRKGFLAVKNEVYPVLKSHPDFTAFTVYGFSTENWKRSPREVKYLMDLYKEILDVWMPELVEQRVRLVHAGRKDRLPGFLLKRIAQAEEESRDYSDFTVYFCLDYGGRDEVLRAAEKGAIETNLEVPDLDLVVRTGGEHRLSNFCIWQAAYAEFEFVNKFLPELRREDVQDIIERFIKRDRRIGK